MSVILADVATASLHNTADAFTTRGAPVLPVITDVSGPWPSHDTGVAHWRYPEFVFDAS